MNYKTDERELLAFVSQTRRLQQYLHIGRKFEIKTDHQPLIWLMNIKDPPSRLLQRRHYLKEYVIEIYYKKGKENSGWRTIRLIDSHPMSTTQNHKSTLSGSDTEPMSERGKEEGNRCEEKKNKSTNLFLPLYQDLILNQWVRQKKKTTTQLLLSPKNRFTKKRRKWNR